MKLTRRAAITALAAAPLAGKAIAAAHENKTITIQGMAFDPAEVSFSAGHEVTWVNADNAPHTATGAGFDTGRLNNGQSATVSFDTPGTYEYQCSFHPSMRGRIIVT